MNRVWLSNIWRVLLYRSCSILYQISSSSATNIFQKVINRLSTGYQQVVYIEPMHKSQVLSSIIFKKIYRPKRIRSTLRCSGIVWFPFMNGVMSGNIVFVVDELFRVDFVIIELIADISRKSCIQSLHHLEVCPCVLDGESKHFQ